MTKNLMCCFSCSKNINNFPTQHTVMFSKTLPKHVSECILLDTVVQHQGALSKMLDLFTKTGSRHLAPVLFPIVQIFVQIQ